MSETSTEMTAISPAMDSDFEKEFRESEQLAARSRAIVSRADGFSRLMDQTKERATKMHESTRTALALQNERIQEGEARIGVLETERVDLKAQVREAQRAIEEQRRQHEREIDDVRLVSARELERVREEHQAALDLQRRENDTTVSEMRRVLGLAQNEMKFIRGAYSNLLEINGVLTQAFNDVADTTQSTDSQMRGIVDDLETVSGDIVGKSVQSEEARLLQVSGTSMLAISAPVADGDTPTTGSKEGNVVGFVAPARSQRSSDTVDVKLEDDLNDLEKELASQNWRA